MYEKIMNCYKDELNDVINYLSLAKEAETDTQRSILRDIAKEEHEHATMLRHILEKHGKYNVDDALKRLEIEAKTHLNEF